MNEYNASMKKAGQLIGHKEDVPFVALALYLNCPIWSGNERHFKHLKDSKEIIWFNSRNLITYLKEKGMIKLK